MRLPQVLRSRIRQPLPRVLPDSPVQILDGESALAMVESVLESSSPMPVPGTTARELMAAALGLSYSGMRTALTLDGAEFLRVRDLWTRAAGSHLPLVVHVAGRSPEAHATSLGSGHEAAHAGGNGVVLCARSAQEAVDLTLVAHRLAETALVPVRIVLDSLETFSALQDVRIPDRTVVAAFAGHASDRIPPPTSSQEALFGAVRRRVPRWYDVDRPAALGGLQGSESYALASAGARPFFLDAVPELLRTCCVDLAAVTGRPLDPFSSQQTKDARVVILAIGAAIETAEQVARSLRSGPGSKVGVIGLRWLRPFPEEMLIEALRGVANLIVLERVEAPLEAEPPLTQTVRGCFARALERVRTGGPGPTCNPKQIPLIRPLQYGIGSLALRAPDLAELVRRLPELSADCRYLGFDFAHSPQQHPKRQVLLDQLRRDHPELERLGLRASSPHSSREPGQFAVALPTTVEGLPRRFGELAQALSGGGLRSRVPSTGAEAHLIVSSTPVLDPGDNSPLDLRVLDFYGQGSRFVLESAHLTDFTPGGALLVLLDGDRTADGALTAASAELPQAQEVRCSAEFLAGVREHGAQVYLSSGPEASHHRETALGAIVAVMESREVSVRTQRASARLRTFLVQDQGPLEPGFSLDAASLARIESGLAAFEAARQGVRTLDLATLKPEPRESIDESRPPWIVHRIDRTDAVLDSLPRFWDQVGVLYRDGAPDALTPDPCLTSGVVPPLAAAFHTVSPKRSVLPKFDATTCTGCGACWTVCPDGAVGPIVLTPSKLLDSAMEVASFRARPAEALRRVASKLSSQMSTLLRSDAPPRTTPDLFRAAYQRVDEAGGIPADAKDSLDSALDALVHAGGDLPLAVTEHLFLDPESKKRGSGEALSIAIDPDACQGCGICVAACEPAALTSEPDSAHRSDAARAGWQLWERMPDASGDTITRLREEPTYSSSAALLLSRHARLPMASSGRYEPGSGAQLALRFALAASELQWQPRFSGLLERTKSLQEQLALALRETMMRALPTENLEVLSHGLQGLPGGTDLRELVGRIELAGVNGKVDIGRLMKLVETARRIADLHWQIERGINGLGRSRTGLALDPHDLGDQTFQFPDNPFAVPVVFDGSGESAAIVAGLLEGQLARVLKEAALLREGQRLASPTGSGAPTPASWSELTPEERSLFTPIWLIGDSKTLGGRIGRPGGVLDSALPVKVLACSDGSNDPSLIALLALAHRDVYIVQSSIGYSDHLLEGLRDAVRHDGPALVHVLGPSPRAHGWRSDQAVVRARAAVDSRAFPLFRYDPTREGVFGSRFDLDGNPPEPATIDEHARRTTDDADTKREMSGANGTGQENPVVWQILQELAGEATPFTALVRTEVEAELAQRHAAELATQKSEYETRLAQTEERVRTELTARLRRRLAEAALQGGPAADVRGKQR